MKKLAMMVCSIALLSSSMGCGLSPLAYPDPGPWGRYNRYGNGFWEPYAYSDDDDDRHSDSDTIVLGAVLGTAAIIGTVIAVDAIRNQPTAQPAPHFVP